MSTGLFVNRFGGVLTARSVERLVKRYAAYYSIHANVSPRDLRRAFERQLIIVEADEWLVQYLLGFSSVQLTVEVINKMRAVLTSISKKIGEPMPVPR
jgi:site-specific recombinase XerD